MSYNKFTEIQQFELKPFNTQPTLYEPNTQLNYAPKFKPTRKVTFTESKTSTPIFINPATNHNKTSPTQLFTNSIPTNPQIYPSKPLIYQAQVTENFFAPIAQQPQNILDGNSNIMYYPNQGLKTIDNSGNYSSNQTMTFKSVYKKKDYYNEKLPEPWIRTSISGIYKDGSLEFDDFYENLKDMFFTPELDEMKVWHTDDYIWGIQIIYRDTWGKDKEYYKGNPHYGKNQSPNNFLLSSLKLNYDDNIVEIRVNEGAIITGLYIKTFLGKEFKVGKLDNLGDNLIQPLTKAVSIGGSHNGFCLEHLYFYLN